MLTAPPPFRPLTTRAQKLVQKLEAMLRDGRVTTRSQFLLQLLSALQRFTQKLGGPTLEIPQLKRDDLLQRRTLEVPFAQAGEDVELAFDQIDALRSLNRQVANLSLAEGAGLRERLAHVTARVDQFRLWISDAPGDYLWVGDTFNDLAAVDPGSSVWVDTKSGLVSLAPVSSRSLSGAVRRVSIDREYSRGGLPGNNLEVQHPGVEAFTGDRPEPDPVTWRETTKTDSLAALWDGSPDTWFEWEKVRVPVPQPAIRAGNALVYDPSGKERVQLPNLGGWHCYVRWPGESGVDTGERRRGYPLVEFVHPHGDGSHDHPEARWRRQGRGKAPTPKYPRTPRGDGGRRHDRRFSEEHAEGAEGEALQLGLLVELDRPRPVSWLQLTPYLKFGTYPTVEQILVSADGERWQALLHEPTVLHPRMHRGIDFSRYGMGASNFEGVGVWTVPATPIRYLKLLLRQEQSYPCPLGISHPFFTRVQKQEGRKRRREVRVQGPIPVVGDPASLPGETVSLPAEDAVQSQGRLRQRSDLFQAERLCIGIRDFLIEERVYRGDGQLVAKPFQLARPVRAVALLATEQIPESWPARTPEGERWIRYEVSPDGDRWYPVIPQETELEDSVVRFEIPTTQLHFRATFRRPEETTTESPALLAYGLKMLAA